MTLKDAALGYAAQGMAVFPLVTNGKQPLTSRGFKDASTDPETVAAWWDATPDANIGYAVPEGLLVVDVDPRNGGGTTMRKLREQHGPLPTTKTVDTASGGSHYYFTVPEGVAFKSVLGPGVDLKRGGKGYVILPPSKTDAGTYEPRGKLTPVPCPPWILADFTRQPRDAGVVAETAAEPKEMLPFEDGTPYGAAAMERELGKLLGTAEGGRNEALNRASFALGQLTAGGELRGERAVEHLALAAERMGLDREEAEGTIRSGFEAGLLVPRSAPELREDAKPAPKDVVAELREMDGAPEGPFWVDWSVDVPPAEFWADPVLPKHAYVLVFGPTQASKSMVWLGIGAEASRRGVKVSYYSLENPVQVDVDRLRRMRPNPETFRLTNQPLDISNAEQVAEFIGREQGRDVVIIDTYSHAFGSGDFGGDHNAKAIAFARVIRLAMRKTGATFVVIDHTGFANRDDPRDSSAKRQQVDVAILMLPDGSWERGKPARFLMENKKSARFANPFEYAGSIIDGAKLDNDEHDRRALDIQWAPGSLMEWSVP